MSPPLNPIGDIATPDLTENVALNNKTWETAADWDNAVSSSGIEHEPERDETTLRLGQQNTHQSPLMFARFYTGSGSTLEDVSGNNNDGSFQGTLTWDTAPSPRFAGSIKGGGAVGDATNHGSVYGSASVYEFECWFYPTSTGKQKIMEQEILWTMFYDRNGGQKLNFATFGANSDIGPALALDTWHHAYFRWTPGGDYFAWINGSSYTASISDSVDGTTQNTGLFDDPAGDSAFSGKIAEARMFEGGTESLTSLSDTLWVTSGSLTTATKTFSASTQPNLTNLSYALNGESITLDVIRSPGGAGEEIVSQSLAGASSYSLSWSSSHTDFRVQVNMSTSDATISPQFGRVTLNPP